MLVVSQGEISYNSVCLEAKDIYHVYEFRTKPDSHLHAGTAAAELQQSLKSGGLQRLGQFYFDFFLNLQLVHIWRC